MTDILGHDIEGRPLRVGDEVRLALGGLDAEGRVTRSSFVPALGKTYIKVDWKYGMGTRGWESRYLRKLHSDHRPADESFGEMMGKLTGETA